MKHILRFTFFLSLCLLGIVTSYGQQLPFQGRLMQNNLPVNDTLEISFAVPAASWTETHPAVIVTEGLYSVVLGSVSPMPENLFDGVSEQSLEIAINGTSLSPVTLYPSLSKARTRINKELGTAVASDTTLFTTVTGGATTGYNIAAYTEMTTNAGNITYYGKTVSKAGTTQTQYGIVGEALGEGTGLHLGVYGEAAGKGKANYGLYGLANGPGDGSTGYGTGSYNNGVVGRAAQNTWGNTGVFGRAHGDKGVDNIGVVGWSEVKTGSDTTVNSGLLGWAKGTGVNRGVVGLANGGAQNWAGWFEGDVKMEGKYLHARLDSISVNDANGRQAIMMSSISNGIATSFIGGYGSNGKRNFSLYSGGLDRNFGNLGLYNAEGVAKAWLSAFYTQQTGQAAGLLSLYGPSGGWIGAGFKHWDADSAINLPYISLEGNKEHQALLWMSVDRNQEGQEYGAINLTSADGRNLRIDAYTQIGIPSRGPTTENFLMTGKDWEGKGDYPLFELRGTINSAADGTGYTLPLAGIGTNDDGTREWGSVFVNSGAIGGNTVDNRISLDIYKDGEGNEMGALSLRSANGKTLTIDANTQIGYPAMGPNTENFLMTGKDWEGKGDYPIFELRGTINSMADGTGYTLPLVALGTSDDAVHEMGYFGIQAGAIGSNSTATMVNLEVRKNSLGLMSGTGIFRGEQTENVVIGSADWETGGTERGLISLMGNSQRTGNNGGTYNPTLFMLHVTHDGTEEVGAMHIENQAGNVAVDLNAAHGGMVVVKDGSGSSVSLHGNGDINATGIVTASNVSSTSDRRYKENIQPLSNSLANVRNMKGVSYYWKDKVRGNGRQIGLIAQEVEAIYPEFVHTNEEGYKSVNYAGMVAVLIEAVKELENQVKALEQDKASLSSENAALKASLESGMNSLNERMLQLEKMLGQQATQASVQSSSALSAGK